MKLVKINDRISINPHQIVSVNIIEVPPMMHASTDKTEIPARSKIELKMSNGDVITACQATEDMERVESIYNALLNDINMQK